MKEHWGTGVASGAATITFFTILAKILGFAQTLIIANRFGAGMAVDAFAVAFSSIVFTLIVIPRDLLQPFLPLFTEHKTREGETAAWRFASSAGTWIALLIGAAAGLGMIHAEKLIRLASNFESEETLLLTATLTRIMLPAAFFMALFWLATLIMHAYKRFGPPAAAEVINKIVIIASIVLLHTVLGIRGLAVGVVLGALATLLFPVVGFGKTIRLFKPSLDWKSPVMKKMARLVLPILIGTLIAQSRVILNNWFASGMGEGMPASLLFAKRLSDTIVLLVPFAIGTAIYPFFSEMTARRQLTDAGNALAQVLRLMAVLFVPLSVGLGILRVPFVQILFHHGLFTMDNVHDTAAPLLFYTAGLTILAWEIMLMRFYFSAKDTLTPITIGLGCMALHVAMVAMLRNRFGHVSIPMAEALSKGVKVALLLVLIGKITPFPRIRENLLFMVKLFVAATAMGAVVYGLAAWSGVLDGITESVGIIARIRELGLPLALCAATGSLVYAALIWALRIPEARIALDFAVKRISHR